MKKLCCTYTAQKKNDLASIFMCISAFPRSFLGWRQALWKIVLVIVPAITKVQNYGCFNTQLTQIRVKTEWPLLFTHILLDLQGSLCRGCDRLRNQGALATVCAFCVLRKSLTYLSYLELAFKSQSAKTRREEIYTLILSDHFTATMNAVGINSLPEEVLVQIFDHPDVPLGLLLKVALTCRRLHYTCLPLYLARFGIHDPSQCCDILFQSPLDDQDEEDALSGLRAALFIQSTKKVVCRFDDLHDYRLVMKNMDRLHNFIFCLTSVDDVTLIFGNQRCGCCSDFDPGEVVDEELEKWSQTTGRIFNLILSKLCTSLTITGGRYMGHSYSFKSGSRGSEPAKETEADKSHSTFSTIKNLFGKGKQTGFNLSDSDSLIDVLRGNNWQFNRTPGTGNTTVLTSLSTPAQKRSILRSLDLQSMMFTVPPLLHWFISVLQLPSIQSLSLRNLSVHRKCWPAIFSLVATSAPHLVDLHLSSLRQLNPTDILGFVSCFPHLTTLHIGRDVDSFDNFDLGSFPDFPCLVSLHAPAAWIFKLLSSQKNGLSRLESLSIVYNMKNDGLSHWIQRPSVPSIPILLKEQDRPLTISLTVNLGSSPGWKMLEHINTPGPVQRPEIDDISSLALVLDQQIKRGDIALAQVLPKWTALFRRVRHLSLEFHSKVQSIAETMTLAHQIIQEGKLSLLSSLEVNGEEIYGIS